MFFEKQRPLSSLCCVHAANNLLSVCAFKQKDFDKICQQLAENQKSLDPDNFTWGLNPHRHIFGGDYDVNVLMKALQTVNFNCQWIDQRGHFDISKREKPITGYILNVQKTRRFYHSLASLSNRHWIAVKQFEGQYYLLDSNKDKQAKIQNINSYLNKQLSKGSFLIQVRRKDC